MTQPLKREKADEENNRHNASLKRSAQVKSHRLFGAVATLEARKSKDKVNNRNNANLKRSAQVKRHKFFGVVAAMESTEKQRQSDQQT